MGEKRREITKEILGKRSKEIFEHGWAIPVWFRGVSQIVKELVVNQTKSSEEKKVEQAKIP